ncbi:MAG: DNA polymerase Y family protein [bacterium]
MERYVVHIAVPEFHVQMECLRVPKLKGRPLAVVQTGQTRALVRAASPEAQISGVQKGMLLSAAKGLCRDLLILPYDTYYYQSGSTAVFNLMRKMSPLVEHTPLGKGYADLSYLARNPNRRADVCYHTMKDIRSLGVNAVAALAGNKLVSMIAAQTATGREDFYHVRPGHESAFLSPHPAHLLPAVEEKTWRQLELMNLRRIGIVAGLPCDDLAVLFGRIGRRLYEQARGIDLTPVIPEKERHEKVFGVVLSPDTNDFEVLRDRLLRMAEEAGMALRAERVAAPSLILEIEYADRRSAQAQCKLRAAANDDLALKQAAEQLLHKALKRRVSVRMLLLRLPQVVPLSTQLSLFENTQGEKRQSIDAALDAIKGRFGNKVGYARTF